MATRENPRYKWEVLALLWFAFLFNQADRQVFNIVLPLLRTDLELSDAQLGIIATLFNLVYALLVPIAGYVGDVFSKKWVVVISILFWSAATLCTGFASGVLMLIVFRSIATGGGEAFFGPANYSLLAKYHTRTRAFAMSIHQTSYYVGIIISGISAAYIAERWGWRYSFFVFGALGLVHGVIMWIRLKDKEAVADEVHVPQSGERIRFFDAFRVVFRTPTALILTAGFSALIFGLTGYLTWMPTYLYERFELSLSQSGFHSMFYTHIFAFLGILVAGRWSDRIAVRRPQYRILLQSVGLLVACPFLLLMGHADTLFWVYVGLAGFGFMRAFFDANTYAVLYDVIPEKYHSGASGVMIMIGFFVGSFSPLILGLIKPTLGLSAGFSLLAASWFAAAVLLFIAFRFFMARDVARARSLQ